MNLESEEDENEFSSCDYESFILAEGEHHNQPYVFSSSKLPKSS